MKWKKLAAIVLSGALLLGTAGCGNDSAAGENGGGDGCPSDVKIGVIIPGSPTDGGFCQQGAEAGEALKTTYGYDVRVIEATTAETVRQEAENMAADDFRIVFGHGGQCASPFAEICEDYPDTWFVTFGGNEIRDNLFPVVMCAEEATYVQGIVAAMMSQTGIIGTSLAGDYPAYTKTITAMELGAKSVNPEVEVLNAVLSAADPNECAEITLNQIQSGADMIFSNSNEGVSGAIKAVNESEGVYTFGYLGDYFDAAPGKVLLNIIGDYTKGYDLAAQTILGDAPKADYIYLTIANDCVRIEWNEELKSEIPEDVIAAAEQAIEDIKSGAIDVPNEYEQDKAQELLAEYDS